MKEQINEHMDTVVVIGSIMMKFKYFTLTFFNAVICYVLSMWVPTSSFAEVMFLSIGLNLGTGVVAMKVNKESFMWKKFLLVPLKCVLYPAASMVMHRYSEVYHIGVPVVEVVTGTMAGAELISAGNNFQRIFGVSFLDALKDVFNRFGKKN